MPSKLIIIVDGNLNPETNYNKKTIINEYLK